MEKFENVEMRSEAAAAMRRTEDAWARAEEEVQIARKELQSSKDAVQRAEEKVQRAEEEVRKAEADLKDVVENYAKACLGDDKKLIDLWTLKLEISQAALAKREQYLTHCIAYRANRERDLTDCRKDLVEKEQFIQQLRRIALQPARLPSVDENAPQATHDHHMISDELLRRFAAIVQISRPQETPTLSFSALGNQILTDVKDVGNFIEHGDSAGQPAIVSASFADVISRISQEKVLSASMTDPLNKIAKECGLVLVNSEDYPWLEQHKSAKIFDLKPDLFVTHCGMYVSRREPEPASSDPSDNLNISGHRTQLRKENVQFRFGVVPRHLYDSVIVMEGKLKLSNGGLGELTQYLQCLQARKSRGVLFDKTDFWMVSSLKGNPFRVETCKWTYGGSHERLCRFLREGKSDSLLRLERACQKLGVSPVEGNSFLGQGATGQVFRVVKVDGEDGEYAMKIVPSKFVINLYREVDMLTAASSSTVVAQLCCKSPVALEDSCGGGGAAILIQPVGEPVEKVVVSDIPKVFETLSVLHRAGFHHGDARLPNLLRRRRPDGDGGAGAGEFLWIDMMMCVSLSNEQLVRHDLVTLSKSILSIHQTDPAPQDLLQAVHADLQANDKNSYPATIKYVMNMLRSP